MAAAPVTLTVLLDDVVDPHEVEPSLPGEPFHVATHAIGLAQAREVAGTATRAAVVGCAGPSELAEALVAVAARARSGRPTIVLAQEADESFLERLFEAGADDVLVLPEAPERVAFALRKAIARREGSERHGKVVAVIGPKGGTGKTIVSTNLAVSLASTGHRTILVDGDLQFGDVAIALGLEPRLTMADLAHIGGTLDAEKVSGYLTEHESGLRVLAAPLRPDDAAAVSAELLTQILLQLRELAEVIVVDSGPGFPPEVIATIDVADDICVVGTLDVASLKDSKLGLETLALMGRDPQECHIVLNRADSHVGISARDVENVLGRSPDARVPSDRDVPRSLNEGRPIVVAHPRSSVSKALAAFAVSLDGGTTKDNVHLLAGRA